MSVTIETDLKDILNKLDQRFDRMEQSINDLKLGQSEIKGEIKNLDTKVDGLGTELKGEIKNLGTKISGLSTRIDSQEFLSRTIVGGLIIIILGGAAKMFWNFPTNP